MLRGKVWMLMLSLFVFAFSNTAFAQSKKDIKKHNLTSQTVKVYDYVGGKEQPPRTEIFERYDKYGNLTEDTEYNKDGTFKKKEIRKYNKAGELLEELKYNASGGLISKLVITYDSNNEKINQQLTDGSGKMLEWFKYGYNALGERTFELELDKDGKTIRKSLFTYDKNGLRKEKKVYNGADVLIAVKKYTYNVAAEE